MTFVAVSPTRSVAAKFSKRNQKKPTKSVVSDCQDQFLARVEEVQRRWDVKERKSRQRMGHKRLLLLLDLIRPTLQ